MGSDEPLEGSNTLDYPAPVSPYLSVSPYVAQARTFLRFYPEGTDEVIETILDEILALPEEPRFTESIDRFLEQFNDSMEHTFLEYLPISRDLSDIIDDLYGVFERGQRSTVSRLLNLDDARSHLVVVVYTELIKQAFQTLNTNQSNHKRVLSSVFPLLIRLDRVHGNKPMTDSFVKDAALAEYYLREALGLPNEDHPGDYEFDVIETDVLAFGVVITYRTADITKPHAATMLGTTVDEFERLLAYHSDLSV